MGDTEMEIDFTEAPASLAALPRDRRGYPVPWFVKWYDGQPDFRVIDTPKWGRAVAGRRCWVCGEKLTRYLAWCLGPMCVLNRISSEPPAHKGCALFAAKYCPFLSNPRMHRQDHNLPSPDLLVDPAGIHFEGNPGICVVWIALDYEVFAAPGGQLIQLGEPVEVRWFQSGERASPDAATEALRAGFQKLGQLATTDEDHGILAEYLARAERWLPLPEGVAA
jgi:hypothetical protein